MMSSREQAAELYLKIAQTLWFALSDIDQLKATRALDPDSVNDIASWTSDLERIKKHADRKREIISQPQNPA